MFSALCVVALGLMSSAARGRGLREGESLSGLHRLHREFGLDEEPHSLERSELSKRSAGLNGQTCTALAGVESSLHNNTHTFTFKVRTMGSLSLAWVGDGSGVLLVLTTFQVPLFMMRFGQSNLYRSEDYGKTFKDVTHLINHTFIQTEFGIAISPDHSGKVILTGDVSEVGGFRLFRSQDFGLTFVATDLPFEPLIQMLYNPGDSNVLLSLSITVAAFIFYKLNHALFLRTVFLTTAQIALLTLVSSEHQSSHEVVSEGAEAAVRVNHESATAFLFSPQSLSQQKSLQCENPRPIWQRTKPERVLGVQPGDDKGMLELRKTSDYGRSFKTIATRVYSFVLGGRFVFASIMTGAGTERMIHVSVDGGEVWNMAQLPTVNHEQFYSILAANQDMIFMHVDDPGDSGVGTIYVSDDRGTVFSKSLERHLYTTTGSDTDFTVITSLRGVYMTSALTEDGAVETVITFDQGARWQTLRRPQNSHCDTETSTNRPNRCRLHIHASYSTTMKMNVPMLPLSQPNAVGLILAHGSVGDAESALSPDVYVSDDGGYSWMLALRGPITMPSWTLEGCLWLWSTPTHLSTRSNEGQCWHTYNFTSDPLHFSGMDSEPGSRSMNVSLWGYRNDYSKWVVITIDFKKLLTRDCTEEDYVQWLAHSADPSGSHDGCVLGYKETLFRLRKDSVCWNGRGYGVTKKISPAHAHDFGYYRPENSSDCVEQEELKGRPLEFCLNGTTEQLQTSGYRKIPGDQCEGGFQPDRKETDLRRMCTSNALYPNSLTETSSPNAAVIVMVVIVVLLTSAVAGVWLVKKYVCGGRFLVHRYSVMREHVEANKIEGVDDVDPHYMETGKAQYNEDSDQDLLE
ncbi:hypothetical protein INR49_031037 [Caranx melampygus]|nr:hypothetical protein INR49_031037 [Caranx melampygus]